MTTRDENERLTCVGPGTPMGNLLQRYWQPVGTEPELVQVAVIRDPKENEPMILLGREQLGSPQPFRSPYSTYFEALKREIAEAEGD